MFLGIIFGLFIGYFGFSCFFTGIRAIVKSQTSNFFSKLEEKAEQDLKAKNVSVPRQVKNIAYESLSKRMLWGGIFNLVFGIILIVLAAWILQKLL